MKKPKHAPFNWTTIDAAAEALGVKHATRIKWRQRKSVPHRWRIPIIQHTGGVVSAATFDQIEKTK
jgi:hypothetical protein